MKRKILIVLIGIWPLIVFFIIGAMSDQGTVGISQEFEYLPWLQTFLTIVMPIFFVCCIADFSSSIKLLLAMGAVFYTQIIYFFIAFGLGCLVFSACL